MAVTTDFTFQYKDDGIILGEDVVPGQPFVDITGVTGLDSGEFRVQDRTREGGDGGFQDTGFKEMRVVVITAEVYGDESYLELLRNNWRPFVSGENGFVGGYPFYYIADGLRRKVVGRSLGMKYDWAQMRRIGKTEVQFQLKCEDPTIYSADLKTSATMTLLPLTVTGYGYNRAYNRTYGGGTSGGGAVNAANAGNKTTYPDIVINGPVVNPYVLNDSWPSTNIPRIKLGGTLDVSDQIIISMRYRTVRLNGVANRRTWVLPPYVWWGLLPGDNFIRFGADTNTGATAFLTYSDAVE